jgi:hypothetical protein
MVDFVNVPISERMWPRMIIRGQDGQLFHSLKDRLTRPGISICLPSDRQILLLKP